VPPRKLQDPKFEVVQQQNSYHLRKEILHASTTLILAA
jgi:hypothetical protein